MPVIVVGADTPLGQQVVKQLAMGGGEVRAFVSDPFIGRLLKALGAKVAVGDLSDASHVAAASLNVFSAVLVETSARDGRELAFADGAKEVFGAWITALREARVRRVIWLGSSFQLPALAGYAPEMAFVDPKSRSSAEIAVEVADLNDRDRL